MIKCHILTPYTGEGTADNPFTPEVVKDYVGQIQKFLDITRQDLYPDPNLMTVMVFCESNILDDIESNPKYYVISSEEV